MSIFGCCCRKENRNAIPAEPEVFVDEHGEIYPYAPSDEESVSDAAAASRERLRKILVRGPYEAVPLGTSDEESGSAIATSRERVRETLVRVSSRTPDERVTRIAQQIGQVPRSSFLGSMREMLAFSQHVSRGRLLLAHKDYRGAIEIFEKCLPIAQKLGDPVAETGVYSCLGDAYTSLGDRDKAIEYHEKSLGVVQKSGDRKREGSLFENLARSYSSFGNHDKGLECYEKSLAIAQELGDREGEGMVYSGIGIFYESLGNYPKAVEYFEKNLSIVQEIGDFTKQVGIYGCLGSVLCSMENYPRAIECYFMVMTIAERIGNPGLVGTAFVCLGSAYSSSEDYPRALECLKKSLAIALELGDRRSECKAYATTGLTYRRLGNFAQAIKCLEKGLVIALEIRDREEEVKAYESLANAYQLQGNFQKALEYNEKRLASALQDGDGRGEMIASRGLGVAHTSLGNYAEGIKYQEKSLAISKEIGDRRGEGTSWGNLGVAYFSLKNYSRAIECHEQGLAIAKEVSNHQGEVEAYGNLGNDYISIGEYGKAINCLEKSLTIAQEIGDRRGQGASYGNLGNVYFFLRNYEKAIEYHKKSLAVDQEIGNRRGEGTTFGNLANANLALGKNLEAIERQENSFAIAQEVGDPDGEKKFYNLLGNAYLAIGNHAKAIEFFERNVALNQRLKDRHHEGLAFGNLGVAYQAQGNFAKAIECQQKCLEITQEVEDRTGEGSTYLNLASAKRDAGDFEEAAGMFEKSIRVYASIRGNLEDDENKITIFEEQSKAFVGLENLRFSCDKFRDALHISESRRALSLADSISAGIAHAPSVEEIQSFSGTQGTSLVYYSLVPLQDQKIEAAVWVVSPDGGIHFRPIALDSLADDIEGLQDLMKGDVVRDHQSAMSRSINSMNEVEEIMQAGTTPAARAAARRKARAFRKKLQAWHTTFIAPIKEHLPEGAKLTIIPDGFLSQLPFAIFMDEEGKYLIEDHPISIAPSVQVLGLLQERKAAREPAKGSLIVGNPKAGVDARDLPMAEQEAVRLKELLCTPNEKVLVRGRAKAEAVTKAMTGVNYIHLACHGEQGLKTNVHSVFEGAFLMSPDEGHEKGLLYAEEIGKLKVNADCVYLSACKSGKGAIKREGTIGPMRSFLAAGASSVVGTLWSLPDSELTVAMVTGFYERVLAGMAKDEALREVMLMAIEQKRNSPHAWGAFVLTGLAN